MTTDDPSHPSAPALQAGPRTGAVIGGRYRLVAPLAEGGMGSVWRAEHQTLHHAVAVKFLSGGLAASPSMRARFEREARVAAKIAEDSRHVVKVTDHGVDELGTPWLVMELLHGEALDQLLRREHRFPLDRVASIVRQIARALDVAHRHGVVHRDLKPANVFLCRDLDLDDLGAASAPRESMLEEDAKLLDFGVAKSLWEDEDAPTRDGIVIGTPSYMSPEQIAGEPIDLRTDVWALGAIAYRMLVGRPPFGVGTTSEIAARIASTEPTPPSEVVPSVPPEVDATIAKALAKSPDDRYRSARELAEALTSAQVLAVPTEGSVLSTNDGAVVSARAATASPTKRRAAVEAAPDRGRRRAIAFALAIAALLLIVALMPRARTGGASAEAPPTRSTPSAPRDRPSGEVASASISASAAFSALPSTSSSERDPRGASSGSSTLAPGSIGRPKVVDTWHKKDEM